MLCDSAANLHTMHRFPLLLVACLLFLVGTAQDPGSNAAAITYSRSIGIPLNGVMLFDKATEAWTWTFGKEPGAKLLRSERAEGVIEATARLNFRSEMLTGREESMGIVQYRVLVHVRAGECRITVSELTHSGNRTTSRGGIHLGLLAKGEDPLRKAPGMGGSNTRRLYTEIKDVSQTRITGLLQAFESRLKASVEP